MDEFEARMRAMSGEAEQCEPAELVLLPDVAADVAREFTAAAVDAERARAFDDAIKAVNDYFAASAYGRGRLSIDICAALRVAASTTPTKEPDRDE